MTSLLRAYKRATFTSVYSFITCTFSFFILSENTINYTKFEILKTLKVLLLKLEIVRSSGTLVCPCNSTRRYSPEVPQIVFLIDVIRTQITRPCPLCMAIARNVICFRTNYFRSCVYDANLTKRSALP